MIVQLLGLFPSWITVNYNQFLYPKIVQLLQFITTFFSFSIGDILYLIVLFSVFFSIFKLGISKEKNYKRWFANLLLFLNIFYFLFQFLWGLNYQKLPLDTQFSMEKYQATPQELYEVTTYFIKKTNELKAQEKTQTIDFEQNTINLRRTYQKLLPKLHITYLENAPVYRSFYSPLISYLGIGGYYNPFTASAQVSSYNFRLDEPFVIGHEMAHQYGFASEKEANYVSFLVNMYSGNKTMQYSACYNTLFRLLFEVYKTDNQRYKEFKMQVSPAVLADRKAEIIFYEKYQGKINDAFSEANNLYLKANKQSGIESYSYYIQLVINQYISEKSRKASIYIFN